MNVSTRIVKAVVIGPTLVVMLLVGCAPLPATRQAPIEVEMLAEREEPAGGPTPSPAATPAPSVGRALPALPDRPNRLIVKSAELNLLVSETDVAIDRVTQIVADCSGYIISSRVWYEGWQDENYKYATITIGVPVDQFERAMRRLRGLALRVVDETASGQDVTDEYVDLQSRLRNLEATRDRIRGFLDQATTVDEALVVNEQLAAVEAQIEQVQGRMNYLFDRAGYSTITAQIAPQLPEITPTPTPTPIPPWSPSDTIKEASGTLGAALRALTDMAIWFGIVVVPMLAPVVLVVALLGRWMKRRSPQRG